MGQPVCPNCNNPVGSVFCYKCGSIINDEDNFCPVCGDDRRGDPFSPFERGAKRNPYGPLGIAPDGVDAIDLGLHFRWASCNVGAVRPEKSGNLYAWGETEERITSDWSNYSRCGGSKDTCYDLGRDIAGTEFDVARVKWTGKWQMPSCQQVEELNDRCTCERTFLNDIQGVRCFGPNGNSIFLPDGSYWLSEPNYTNCAHFFTIGENGFDILSFKQFSVVVLAARPRLKFIRPVIDSFSFSSIY
jgi:hypothetical protein